MDQNSLGGDFCLIRIHYKEGPYTPQSAYDLFSATYSPWPTLDALRPSLDIQQINTGQEYHLPGPWGIVTDDLERLHAMTDEQGYIRFRSGIEFPMVVYRGQPSEHIPCLPKLARLIHAEDQLLALCRCIAFEEVIGEHPYVRFCERVRLMESPLYVDKEGLAQHYGFPTNLLDVTSNFDVASFFATSYWDTTSRSYQPVKFSRVPGVFYRVCPFLLMGSQEQVEYRDVGWQPLHRPEQQRAAAIKMTKGLDFGSLKVVQKVRFTHSARISTRIWKNFSGGKDLFPSDAPAELADKASRLMQFTRSQIDLAWMRFDEWHGAVSEKNTRLLIESSSGIEVIHTPNLSWDDLDVERDERRLHENFNEVQTKIRWRMIADHNRE